MLAITNDKRIAKNTLALYVQMFFGMLIGLYTARLVLNTLGVENFGIYNVVGGVVAMFGILNSAMASSTSRFVTYELGQDNHSRLKEVFSMSLCIHLLIAAALCLIAESAGMWFLANHLQIPADRSDAAVWVFHLSVISAGMAIINVPFTAVIIAHERMVVLAMLSIVDVLLKLGVAVVLSTVGADKLITYATLMLGTQLIMQACYCIYCFIQFKEVQTGIRWNKGLFKDMTSFAGWSMFGDSAVLLFTQGINILLNVFFGATVNAARGIAVQVQGILYRFVFGFQTALNPQITKSYAANEIGYMHKLIYASSKYSFFLLLLLSMPVFLCTGPILTWWLKIVPEHTVSFVRIMVLIALVDSLANPLVFAAKATGKIKIYQSVLGSLLLMVVPLGYVALKFGLPPESVFIVHLLIVVCGQMLRVWLIRDMIRLPLREYFDRVVYRCGAVMLLAPILPFIAYRLIDESLLGFIVILFASGISIIIWGYFVALDKNEKQYLANSIHLIVKRYT